MLAGGAGTAGEGQGAVSGCPPTSTKCKNRNTSPFEISHCGDPFSP